MASTSSSEFASEESISVDESADKASRSATQINKTWSDSNYFKSAEWYVHFCHVKYGKLLIRLDHRSPDGTTVITDSADHHIRTFVLLVSHCSTGIIFQ